MAAKVRKISVIRDKIPLLTTKIQKKIHFFPFFVCFMKGLFYICEQIFG